MLSYEELMEKYGNKKKDDVVGPSKDNAIYQQYLASKPKVAGGTVNPIITTNPNVKGNQNLTPKKGKTYEQQLAANRTIAQRMEAEVPQDARPAANVQEMIFGTAKRGGTINPAISAADLNSRYSKMTDRENAVYNYYKHTGREKEAKAYLDAIEMDVNQRAAAQRVSDAQKLAEESTMGGLYARYMASLTNPLGAAYGVVQEARGEAIDPNSPLFMGEHIREGQQTGFIGDSTGPVRLAKEAGLGAFDWLTQTATLGAAGLGGKALGGANSALYGASAFGGNVRDAAARGGTAGEAVAYGMIGAAAETITEKLGYDRLFNLGKLAGGKGAVQKVLKDLLPHMGSEFLEEGTTEAVNQLADLLVLGDNSRMKRRTQELMRQGVTESEAVRKALGESMQEIVHSGVVGGISGGMIGGGVSAASRMLGRNALGEDTEKSSAAASTRSRVAVAETAATTQRVAEAQQTGGEMQTEVSAPMGQNVQRAAQKQPRTPREAAAEYGDKYFHENGQRLLEEEAEKRGNVSFLPAFQSYYVAGLTGQKESDIRQTAEITVADREMLTAAYMAGAMDRKADVEARLKGTGKMGQTAGVVLEEGVTVTPEQMALANLTAKVGGMEVVLVDEIAYRKGDEIQYANGKYENGRLYIAMNSESFSGTLFHESMHYIRAANPEGYDRAQQAVFEMAAALEGKTAEAYVKEYQSRYGQVTENLGDILEEMTADAFQKLAADEKSLRNLVRKLEQTEPTVLQQLKEFIDKLLETLQGLLKDNRFSSFATDIHKNAENTEKLQRIFAEELKKAGDMQSRDNKKAEKKGGKYSFAGERAKKADREALAEAKEMEQDGKDAEEIFRKTGWYRGADEKWRFEVDDSEAEFTADGDLHMMNNPKYRRYKELMQDVEAWFTDEFERLSELFGGGASQSEYLHAYLKHDMLYERYPFLRSLKIAFEELPAGVKGAYYASENRIVLDKYLHPEVAKRTLLHEIQHAIQKHEGFSGGSSQIDNYTAYRNAAGEIEARDTEARMNMTAEERRQKMPDRGDENTVFAEDWQIGYSKKLGGYFPKIEISTDSVKEIGISNIRNIKEVIQKVYERLKDDFLSVGNDVKPIENIDTGMQICVYKNGINETFSKKEYYKDLSDEWKLIKIAAALELDEIIRYGEVRAEEAENIHNENSDTTYAYLSAPITVNGREVIVDVDIRRTNRGDRFYMHKIKIADSSSRAAVKRPKSRAELSAKDRVSHKKAKSKGNDVKFSLKEPIEETKDLIAVHNIKEEDLHNALQIGGFPMPSIAIVKDTMGHDKYGEISVVFSKETIDPEADKRNSVYGGDAWTPTVPRVDYPVDYERKRMIENEIAALARQVAGGIFGHSGVISAAGVNDATEMKQSELASKLADQDAVRAAYLAAHGENIEPIYKKKEYDRLGNAFLQKIIQHFGEQKLAEMAVKVITEQGMEENDITAIRKIYQQHWIDSLSDFMKRRRTPEQIAAKAEEHGKNKVRDSYDAGQFVIHAWEMHEDDGGVSDEIDRSATTERLQESVNHKQVKEWIEEKLDGLLGEAGIYNGKDPFTSSGKERTFQQLHYSYTLENLVKAMSEGQKERGEGIWGLSAKGLQSVATAKYKSVEEMKADRNRLQAEEEEVYAEALEKLDERIGTVIENIKAINDAHSDNPYIESDIIGTVILEASGKNGKATMQGVKKHFAKEDYRITDEIAKEIVALYADAGNLPTGYFEAKPKRAVGLEEIRAIIVPDSLGKDMRNKLEERAVEVIEYTEGDRESRLQALNRLTDVKFSFREEDADEVNPKELKKENALLRKRNEALHRQFKITKEELPDRESVRKAAKEWLKRMDSKADAEAFTEKFYELVKFAKQAKDTDEMETVLDALRPLVEDAMEQSEALDTEMWDTYADLRHMVKRTTLKVTDSLKAELEYFGGYNEIRKENFGRMSLSSKRGVPVDVFYMDLMESYPEFFREEDANTQGEMLLQIMEVLDSLKPELTNPFEYNLEEYADEEASILLEKMLEVQMEKPTFADKYEAKLKVEKEKAREARKEYREQLKAEKKKAEDAVLAARIHEGRVAAKKLEKVNAQILRMREVRKQRVEARKKAEYKKSLLKNAKELLKWLDNGTDAKHVPEQMRNGVTKLLTSFDTGKEDRISLLQMDVWKMSDLYRAQEKKSLEEEKEIIIDYDPDTQVLLDEFKEVFDKYGKTVYLDKLNAEEMKKLRDIVRSLKRSVTDANKLLSGKRAAEIAEVAKGFMQDAEEKKTAVQSGITRQLLDFMNLEMLDAGSFFKRLGDTAYNNIYKGLRDGFDKKILSVKEAADFMQETVDEKTVKKWRNAKAEKFELKGREVWLTVPQKMSLYCLMRREQARQHIIGNAEKEIRGMGFKAEPPKVTLRLGKEAAAAALRQYSPVMVDELDVKQILDTLTEEQKKTAIAMQEFLSENAAEWGNEVSMLMFGYRKFTEQMYFPIVSDEDYISSVFADPKQQQRTLQNMGMTKQTNKRANNPIVLQDIFSVYANHVDQMSSYRAFVPALSDLTKFMNYRMKPEDGGEVITVKKFIRKLMGPKGISYVYKLTESINGAANHSEEGFLPKLFTRNMKAASVGANLRVMVQQPVSILRAMDEIGGQYILGSFASGRNDYDMIYRYAPIAQWKAWGNYDMNVGRSLEELMTGQNFWQKTVEWSMAGAGWLDKKTWGRIWKACELETRKKHPDLQGEVFLQMVGQRFSEVIDQTQVVDSVLHRSQIMRSRNLFNQMVTSFMSEPTKTYNIFINRVADVSEAYSRKKLAKTAEEKKAATEAYHKSCGKMTRTFLVLVANGVAVAMAAGIADMLRDDDDEEKALEKWQQAVFGDYTDAKTPQDKFRAAIFSNMGDSFNPMGYIPYMRDLLSILQGYDVSRSDFGWATDLMQCAQRWQKFNAGESEYTLAAMLIDTAGSLSKLTGQPVGNLKRDLFAIKDTMVNHTIGYVQKEDNAEMKYQNKALRYAVGAEKNAAIYAKMILDAKFTGNTQLATRIYNDMVKAGVSNQTLDSKLETDEKKQLKAEAATIEAAEAFAVGDYDGYLTALDQLTAKGYSQGMAVKTIKSVYNKMNGEEEEETFETITAEYWQGEEADTAEYEMLFNAYMSGNQQDYGQMWDILEASGKESKNIKSSMKNRLKKAYHEAKVEKDYQKSQKAKSEFLRLGGKMETLLKED